MHKKVTACTIDIDEIYFTLFYVIMNFIIENTQFVSIIIV